ncbi:hypothetical protein C8J56DRAFT_973061 [Mycena floridula]|nr:hypothetical protein C8J56DRAFT_973061 [Mycena floridula]
MLFKNIFHTLVLTAVVTAGPFTFLGRGRGVDPELILCKEPQLLGGCAFIHLDLPTSCINLPLNNEWISAGLSNSGFECTLFQGVECAGTSVVFTLDDGTITISQITAVNCIST